MGVDKEVVDKSVISSWITIDGECFFFFVILPGQSSWITIDGEYNISFDEDKVAAYVQSLASKYNTYGDEREFLTSSVNVNSVSPASTTALTAANTLSAIR